MAQSRIFELDLAGNTFRVVRRIEDPALDKTGDFSRLAVDSKGAIYVWTSRRLLSLSPTGKVVRNVELRYPKGTKPYDKMFLFREG